MTRARCPHLLRVQASVPAAPDAVLATAEARLVAGDRGHGAILQRPARSERARLAGRGEAGAPRDPCSCKATAGTGGT